MAITTDALPVLPGFPGPADDWVSHYLVRAPAGDVMRFDMGRGSRWWQDLLGGISGLTDGRLARLQERAERQVDEIGTAFRLPGEASERAWPVSTVPLLIGEDEWSGIAAGVSQRARLMEKLLADLYGRQELIRSGALPAAAVTGSPHFWRLMIGVDPPGPYRLHIYAVDLGRGPDGEWRVLADHARGPIGAGYALENRIAAGRVMGALQSRLNVHRLAPFFASFRDGVAAACRRENPRIGLLTPGRYAASYVEQAHLARYLGLMLIEGDDLAVRDGRLYVRTIEGLKRVDALWRRIDARYLDPLAFDARSAIGTPGLVDAMASGDAVIANHPGSGVIEAPALAAFLPRLARILLGERLALPNIATWWCGQPGARAEVAARLDELLVGSAFGIASAGLERPEPMLGAELEGEARARLLTALAQRPMDYVGQEVVRLSTMPAVDGNLLRARPFTLRVFVARDGLGRWGVMPGGFARLGERPDPRAAIMGEGALSADVCIVGNAPVERATLLPHGHAIRRNPGTLPSRAADNLFWLGRYLERGEGLLRLVRAVAASSLASEADGARADGAAARLGALLGEAVGAERAAGADLRVLARIALDGPERWSVRGLLGQVHGIAAGIRDRLSADVWRLIDSPLPPLDPEGVGIPVAAAALQERFSALAGLAAENMGRTAGWRFLDLGRALERAQHGCALLRAFAGNAADGDDLTLLLDLIDSQISYRQRYPTGLALVPVRDLAALDPYNPRSLAFSAARLADHLAALPALGDDGMAEPPVRIAAQVRASLMTADAASLGAAAVARIEAWLLALSDAIGQRFFLQSGETVRASGMTLA